MMIIRDYFAIKHSDEKHAFNSSMLTEMLTDAVSLSNGYPDEYLDFKRNYFQHD